MSPDFDGWVYHVAWAAWVGWFAVWEWFALADDDAGDTLSEHLWAAIFEPSGRPRPVVYYVVVGALVWLVLHIAFRGRYG